MLDGVYCDMSDYALLLVIAKASSSSRAMDFIDSLLDEVGPINDMWIDSVLDRA